MTTALNDTVEVRIPRPEKSSRLLLLFRGLLLFPHYFFLLVVGLVAYVALVINYIVVLVTGRAAFFGFLSGVLRYGTRITAYMYFLTDKYPPFSLGEAPDYPVQVVVPPVGRVHRWRVFSTFLVIPHTIVLFVLMIATAITTFISWLIILVVGRYPAGLFGLAASAVRYQARINGYIYLITSGYPPFSLS
jgi:hypothetical protein